MSETDRASAWAIKPWSDRPETQAISETDRGKLVAHMTLTLLLLFETTPRFGARLQAYRDAGIDLGAITTDMDRRAVFASIGFKLKEEK